MYDENQLVEMKWNNATKEWFESKGYKFSGRNQTFFVKAKDLMPGSAKKINAICDYCKKEYKTQYSLIVKGRSILPKDSCSNCTGKKSSEVSKRKRAKKYIGMANDICKENGYTLLTTEDDYTGVKMNIRFICPEHGEQTMMLNNFIHGHKCIDCSYRERGNNLKHDVTYVIERIESINGNKLLNPYDYKESNIHNLNILCSCGNVFTTSFSNYTRHNVNMCHTCSSKESIAERRIREILDYHNIDYEQEKRFSDCRDVRTLPFDFYLPDFNMIIEFDGKHHFEKVGNRDYETTKRHDEIKNKYCKDKGINIIRIPYWEGHNIEKILTKELNL